MIGEPQHTAPGRLHGVSAYLAAAAACLLLIGGCRSGAPKHVGRPPEGERRFKYGESPRLQAGKTADDIRRGREQTARTRPDSGETDPELERIGVYGTDTYHRRNCKLIADVPQMERILFTSSYDGLDAAYQPCTTCRPGP